jgi:hypothetical protein
MHETVLVLWNFEKRLRDMRIAQVFVSKIRKPPLESHERKCIQLIPIPIIPKRNPDEISSYTESIALALDLRFSTVSRTRKKGMKLWGKSDNRICIRENMKMSVSLRYRNLRR